MYANYPRRQSVPAEFLEPKVPAVEHLPDRALGTGTPYINQWNLTLQKQVGSAWLASASYMGNLGVHENQGYEGNPAIYIPGASCVAD